MRTTLYISNKEVLNFLERNGYTLITLRKIIISEFGYKNSEEFLYPNSEIINFLIVINVYPLLFRKFSNSLLSIYNVVLIR